MADLERRVVTVPVEVRAEGDGPTRLTGYAAVFNTEARIADVFVERIAPGAFSQAIATDDVRALFNHDANFVLGRTTSGTLTLSEDATGLRYDVEPPDTTWARDLMVSVARGDISQSSFAFSVDEEAWDYPKGALPVRTVVRARLFDVSPVTYPAYAETSVSARCLVDAQRGAAVPVVDDQWRTSLSRDRCRMTDAVTK